MRANFDYVAAGPSLPSHPAKTIQSELQTPNLIDGPETLYAYDAAGQLTSTTDARGYTTAITYNDAGWQTKITQPDPDGTVGGLVSPIIQFGYDNKGRQTTQTDALGRVTTISYDSRDRVTKVTEPDPDGGGSATAPETEYAYNNANLLTSVTDPLDRVTAYAYDNANRLLTVTLPDPDGAGGAASPVTTYAYNAMNSVTSVTDALGNVTSTAYDNLQRPTQVTQPDPDAGGGLTSPVTTYTYNAQTLLSKITDALSHDITFGYDDLGRRTTVTNHQSKTTTTSYDHLSRVTQIVTPDPDGAGSETASTTTYTLDRQGRVVQIDNPRGYDTYMTYDAVGNRLSLRDAENNDTTWTYDGLNRITQETNELNDSRYFQYDTAGNLLRKTDRNNKVTRYSYDNLDRLTSEVWVDGGTPTPTVTVATTAEGGQTNEVQRVGFTAANPPMSGTFTLIYSGQTTSAIGYNVNAATVVTALEALSNIGVGDVSVTKSTDTLTTQEWRITFTGALAGTNVNQATIDISQVSATAGTVNAIQATDTQGVTQSETQTITVANATAGTFKLTLGTEQTAAIAYNASASTVDTALEALTAIDTVTVTGNAGGPFTVTYSGTHANQNVAQPTSDPTYLTGGTVARTIGFTYDAASQLTVVDDPAADYTYTYDNLGRLTAELQDITGLTPDIEFAHTWNANGRRLSLAAEIGGTNDFKNDYVYDNLSRMTRVTQQDVSGGNVVADKRVDLAYNAIGQYSSLTRYQSTGTSNLVATTTYTYDTINRLTDLDHKQNTTNLNLYDYGYDAMDRITSITSTLDGASTFTYDKESELTAANHASPIADESYTYDSTGNRTMEGYENLSNNRTTSDGTYDYLYDDEGNRSKRTDISSGDYEEYEWDHRNRLIGVSFYDSGDTLLKTVEYAYDAFNRLVRRTYDADGPGGTSATEQFFAYDGQSINAALDFAGTAASDLTHRNLWAEAVDQLLATEDVASLSSAGNVLWPLADHQNSNRDVADLNEGSGVTSVTNHRFYDSFGNLESETNAAVDLLFAYMGKPLDEVTGLYNFWARIYDPLLGKFVSPDPIGFAAGDPNLARIVHNNILNRLDPTGLEEVPTFGFESGDLATPGGTTIRGADTLAEQPGMAELGGLGTLVGAMTVGKYVTYPARWFGWDASRQDAALDRAWGKILPKNDTITRPATEIVAGTAVVSTYGAASLNFLAAAGVTDIGVVPLTVAEAEGFAVVEGTTTLNAFFRGTSITRTPQTILMLQWYREIALRKIDEYSRMNPPPADAIATQQERLQRIAQQLQAWGVE